MLFFAFAPCVIVIKTPPGASRCHTSIPWRRSPQSKAACVIGWPVEHSRSPLIHGYWIKKYRLNADYRREAVSPENFEEFVRHLAERGYVGANVTIPNKEAACALSKADVRAEKVGAANTLWLDGATLRSTNTDVEGFINNLDASAAGWNRGLDTVVVLGAGGTARAVVYGLGERGAKRIHVVNRTTTVRSRCARNSGKQGQSGALGGAEWAAVRARACSSTRRRSE